jgi:hypothetical protein
MVSANGCPGVGDLERQSRAPGIKPRHDPSAITRGLRLLAIWRGHPLLDEGGLGFWTVLVATFVVGNLTALGCSLVARRLGAKTVGADGR